MALENRKRTRYGSFGYYLRLVQVLVLVLLHKYVLDGLLLLARCCLGVQKVVLRKRTPRACGRFVMEGDAAIASQCSCDERISKMVGSRWAHGVIISITIDKQSLLTSIRKEVV